jgi:hypothetical protein
MYNTEKMNLRNTSVNLPVLSLNVNTFPEYSFGREIKDRIKNKGPRKQRCDFRNVNAKNALKNKAAETSGPL